MSKKQTKTKRKRIMACSCSHGDRIDPGARAEILAFRDEFKPDTVLHLGDFLDTTAFRSGAANGPDAGADIGTDYRAGLEFLKELRPNVVFLGNHDDRLWKLADDHRAMIKEVAQNVIERIETCVALIGAELVPYTGVIGADGWRTLGGMVWGHGVMYNEQAGRDHAEAFGQSCVFGHTHKMLQQPGRTMQRTEGISVGCLCNLPAMGYAKARRASMAWDLGWLYGEYTEDESWLHLHRAESSERGTIPPIKL